MGLPPDVSPLQAIGRPLTVSSRGRHSAILIFSPAGLGDEELGFSFQSRTPRIVELLQDPVDPVEQVDPASLEGGVQFVVIA